MTSKEINLSEEEKKAIDEEFNKIESISNYLHDKSFLHVDECFKFAHSMYHNNPDVFKPSNGLSELV